MEITGTIVQVFEPRTGFKQDGSQWVLQEYVLQTDEQYQRNVFFEVYGEQRINTMAIQAGEHLTVSIDIESREWNGKWYTKVSAWKVQR